MAVGLLVLQKAGSLCILCVYTWVRHVWCGLWRDTSLLAVAGSEAPCESLQLGACFCMLWVAVHTAPGDMKAPVSSLLMYVTSLGSLAVLTRCCWAESCSWQGWCPGHLLWQLIRSVYTCCTGCQARLDESTQYCCAFWPQSRCSSWFGCHGVLCVWRSLVACLHAAFLFCGAVFSVHRMR